MKKKISGWWYLPLLALLGLILYQPAKQICIANDIAEAATFKTVPAETFDQLFDEIRALRDMAMPHGNPSKDPADYCRFLERRNEWELKARKYIAENHYREPQHASALQVLIEGTQRDMSEYNQAYQNVFLLHQMQQVSDVYWKTHSLHPPEVSGDYANAWAAAKMAYLPIVLIWMCGLFLWVHRSEMKLWYEVPRIVIASLAPIVSVFVYPVRIDQTRQVKSAMEFACGILMLIFSFGTAAGSLAKAQTGPLGGKSTNELTKKKRERRRGTLTITTGISSELPSSISGSIFDAAPNLQTTVKVAMDSGWYSSVTWWKGMDHFDPNANMSDWLIGTAGYTRKLHAISVTAEGVYMNPAPLSVGLGDFATVRGTISYALGKNGRQGTIFGTAREMWKLAKGYTDRGAYGYIGYNRNVKVPAVHTPVATSAEIRIDPGNMGRGEDIGFAARAELPIAIPKTHWILRPFIGTQGPIQKERPVKTDNRSWELFGGFQFAFAARI